MNDGLELRQATPADALVVRSLTREAYARWVPVLGREPEPMTADYDEAVWKHRVDLLYAEGEPVGLIELVQKDDYLLIQNVAVAPACRGRGFGRRLLAHAEGVAAGAGYRTLKLYTNKLMAENVRLYEKFGYRVDGEVAFHGGSRINMSKRLGMSEGA